MKAMILAAGRGERMRPLTDSTPKPLLQVAGRPLIEHHLLNLKHSGITEIVINTAWLAEKIHQQLGDGSQFGISIVYSDEQQALETAGGIKQALPLLGTEPFLVINGDIWCNFPYQKLPELKPGLLAHLVLVNNPAHNKDGDFDIENGFLVDRKRFTFSGIGIYHPTLFNFTETRYPLAPLLREAANQNQVSAEYYDGEWIDIGTPERLQTLDLAVSNQFNSK